MKWGRGIEEPRPSAWGHRMLCLTSCSNTLPEQQPWASSWASWGSWAGFQEKAVSGNTTCKTVFVLCEGMYLIGGRWKQEFVQKQPVWTQTLGLSFVFKHKAVKPNRQERWANTFFTAQHWQRYLNWSWQACFYQPPHPACMVSCPLSTRGAKVYSQRPSGETPFLTLMPDLQLSIISPQHNFTKIGPISFAASSTLSVSVGWRERATRGQMSVPRKVREAVAPIPLLSAQ